MTDQSPQPRGSALSRLTRGEKFVAAGSLLVLVSFVLPWMDLSGGGDAVGAFHGAGLLTVFGWVAVVALFVLRSPLFRNTVDLPKMPASEAVMFAVGGGVEILGMINFYAQYHSIGFGFSRTIQFGYLLALAGGILTTVAAVIALRAGARSLYDAEPAVAHPPVTPAQPGAAGFAPPVPPPPVEDAPPAPPPPAE